MQSAATKLGKVNQPLKGDADAYNSLSRSFKAFGDAYDKVQPVLDALRPIEGPLRDISNKVKEAKSTAGGKIFFGALEFAGKAIDVIIEKIMDATGLNWLIDKLNEKVNPFSKIAQELESKAGDMVDSINTLNAALDKLDGVLDLSSVDAAISTLNKAMRHMNTGDMGEGEWDGMCVSFESYKADGKYIHVHNCCRDNGTKLVLWDGDGASQAQWLFKHCGKGWYGIESMLARGKFIHVDGASTNKGSKIVIWDGCGAPQAQWNVKETKGGYQIVNRKANKIFDMRGGVHNGAEVVIWENIVHENLLWDLNELSNEAKGDPWDGKKVAIKSVLGSNKYIHIRNASKDDNATLTLWDGGGATQCNWIVHLVMRGVYAFESCHARGKFIHVQYASTDCGKRLAIWPEKGSPQSLWRIERAGRGYNIVNVKSGKCFDMRGNTSNGAEIVQWDKISSMNLQFTLEGR